MTDTTNQRRWTQREHGPTYIVRLREDDPEFGLSAGDEFEAIRYWLDPREKWTLLRRLSDGFDPSCNQYAHNIEVVRPMGVNE